MVEYQVYGIISAADDNEMLTDLTWLKNNYGAKISSANAANKGGTIQINFSLVEATFDEAVTTLNALKTQYDTDFHDYGLQLSG